MLRVVQDDPVMPVWWGKNQSGMQAREELSGFWRGAAKAHWLAARDQAVEHARQLVADGLHKQVVNRILEPWCWITTIISATEWDNFFKLRCHPEAQPELQRIAEMIRDAMAESIPVERVDHLPYIQPGEYAEIDGPDDVWPDDAWQRISVARCARVSYLTHNGVRDQPKDLELFDRLRTSGHWSPFEHVAHAMPEHQVGFFGLKQSGWSGNFRGWTQYRKTFAGEDGS